MFVIAYKPIVLCILVKSVFPVFKSSPCSAPKVLRLRDLKTKIAKAYAIDNVLDLYGF